MMDAYGKQNRNLSKLGWRAEAIRLNGVREKLEGDVVAALKKVDEWIRSANEADLRYMGEYELLRREREAEKTRADAETTRANAEKARADKAEAEVLLLRSTLLAVRNQVSSDTMEKL